MVLSHFSQKKNKIHGDVQKRLFIYCLLLLVLQPPARREHGGVDGHAHVGAVLELEVVEHVGATGGGRVEVRVVLLVREGAPVDAAEGQYVRGVVARASVRERVDVRVEEARVVVGPRFVVEGLVQADYLRVALDRVLRGRGRRAVAQLLQRELREGARREAPGAPTAVPGVGAVICSVARFVARGTVGKLSCRGLGRNQT